MPKDIDKIMNDVEHNLNKVSIKEANNLSTQREEKALGQNLVEILESDFWKECMEDDEKLLKASQEKYSEYYAPIVAEDPLEVVYDRVLDIIPKLLASVVVIDKNDKLFGIKLDNELERAFTHLWDHFLGNEYFLGCVNDDEWNENDDKHLKEGTIEEYINEIKRLRDKYKNAKTLLDK